MHEPLKYKYYMEILCRIRDVYRLINDFEIDFSKMFGLNLNEAMLLCSLRKYNHCSSGEIAIMLGLSQSNASKVIASAEKKGLLERSSGSEDKRQMFFQLTDDGKEAIDKIHCKDVDMLKLIENIQAI